jgi:hypothetical protein
MYKVKKKHENEDKIGLLELVATKSRKSKKIIAYTNLRTVIFLNFCI